MTGLQRMRVVIVDDEPAAREALATLLAEDPTLELVGQAGNGVEAVEQVRALRPDLLFLDVQMPDRDGFGVLEELGDAVPPGVVFVTAHDEHALRAFEVRAIDYLLKPFGRPRFKAALDRAVRHLEAEDALDIRRSIGALVERRQSEGAPASTITTRDDDPGNRTGYPVRFGVRLGTRTLLVDACDIDWVEADGDYAHLHVGEAAHLVSIRMHQLESQLDPRRFLRIHRSAIVNLERVRELRRDGDGGGHVVLRTGARVRVSRGRWETLEAGLGLG